MSAHSLEEIIASPFHGTCIGVRVEQNWLGVLLCGPSGSGKSDLALRILADMGAERASLVSDDYVNLVWQDGSLMASPPDNLKGIMEVRGVGLVPRPFLGLAPIVLKVDLVSREDVERLPAEGQEWSFRLGEQSGSLPAVKLWSYEPSATAKLRLALGLVCGQDFF